MVVDNSSNSLFLTMSLIYFTLANGAQYEAEATEGQTLLQVAVQNSVDGLLAECGGSCTCGTCHCYIDPAQWDLLAAPESTESDMLDFVADERRETSRLACQIRITPALAGLKVSVPSRQI
jgi:2Fe-2S ferredoxin